MRVGKSPTGFPFQCDLYWQHPGYLSVKWVCACVCVGGVKVDETVPLSTGSAWTCPCSVILECWRKGNVIQTDWLPLTNNEIKKVVFWGGLPWNIFSRAAGCKCVKSTVWKCCWYSSKVSKNAVEKKIQQYNQKYVFYYYFILFYWQITLHFRITCFFLFWLLISKQQLTFNLTTVRCFSAQFEFLITEVPHFSHLSTRMLVFTRVHDGTHTDEHIYRTRQWGGEVEKFISVAPVSP